MAKEKNIWPQVGAWAFVLGLVISILAGLFTEVANPTTALVLGILGLIVGLLNVSDKEVQLFLVAMIAFLVAAGNLGGVLSAVPAIGQFIPTILNYIVVFIAPAAGIVSLKAIYDVARAD